MTDVLHDILEQLLDVRTRLEDAPGDAVDLRVELRERRRKLYADAARASGLGSAASSLKRYLQQLELRHAEVIDQRLAPSCSDGCAGGIRLQPAQIDKINRRIDTAGGLSELEREIARIRAILATPSRP